MYNERLSIRFLFEFVERIGCKLRREQVASFVTGPLGLANDYENRSVITVTTTPNTPVQGGARIKEDR